MFSVQNGYLPCPASHGITYVMDFETTPCRPEQSSACWSRACDALHDRRRRPAQTTTVAAALSHGANWRGYLSLSVADRPFLNFAASARPIACGRWRMRTLRELQRSTLRQRQLAEMAAGFERAGLNLVMLKGAWLAESVYANPVLRSMTDIDVLIRTDQRDRSHAVMLQLGYTATADTLHSRFAYDQGYRHPQYPYAVEIHWAVSSERETDSPEADMAAIWRHVEPTQLYGFPCFALSVPDQLAHLVHHMLHHLFAVPLRSYLDIALLMRTRRCAHARRSLPLARAGKPERLSRSSCVSLRICLTYPCPPP